MKNPTTLSGSSLAARMKVALATMLISMMAASGKAATTSFPQYPLMTGGNAIPPNILLILDDSRSMEFVRMPSNNEDGLRDTPADRSYVNNTLYYNPARTYRPWRTASTVLTERLPEADFRAVAASSTSITGKSLDLCGSVGAHFYVPKVGIPNPGTYAQNYDKYRIAKSNSAASLRGCVVQRQSSDALVSGTIPELWWGNPSSCIRVPASGHSSVTVTTSASSGDAYLYVYGDGNCSKRVGEREQAGNDKTYVYNNPPSMFSFKVSPGWKLSDLHYEAVATRWVDATPTGRSQAEELQNIANWYHYHRSRGKMAKAGASEAFGLLGKNYRVGFDTIWNRPVKRVAGSTPAYPIPWYREDGLFTGSNRKDFYENLQGAIANDGTPLHGALQRAGRYYATEEPYKDSSGNMLSCRQNYALLTTDGYWNYAESKHGFISSDITRYSNGARAGDGNGNVDSGTGYPYEDNYRKTLADVAYFYWQDDLRKDLEDNVPTSSGDKAYWQHMTTFGISIGQQGTLNPNNPVPSSGWPDPTQSEDARRIDDLWHASINGRGSFVVASDTEKFASALTAALKSIDSRSASGSNIASSSTRTDTSTLTFVASFTSGSWLGELAAIPFNAALTGFSETPLWSMSRTFRVKGVNAGASFAKRTVLTSFGGIAQSFDSSTLASASVFRRESTAHAVSIADNINYLRGDQSLEAGLGKGELRKRSYPFGDIVDSSPAYSTDSNTVYVGSNDGMLHAVNAANGKVLFSYVPGGLDFAELAKLSSPDYEHRYFVDGQIDVISRADQGSGRNILVAALGRGGRGVFALDVTKPVAMGADNVLWDNTTQDTVTDTDMGYVLGAVRIRKGNGGKTYALVPNGIDSPNGTATLYAYELNASGGIAKTHKLVADPGSGNGLMSLGMADLNADGRLDVVYGGDLKGNVWRWDFSGDKPKAAPVKLFQAVDASNRPQPITGGIGVGRNSSGRVMVGFGTGRFISNSDVPGSGTASQTQSIYGLVDNATPITGGRARLQPRTIPYSGKDKDGDEARGFENYSVLPADKLGWYLDLPVPERVISAPTISGTAMYLTSVIPANGSDCSGANGSGYLNAINLFTGTAPKTGGYFADSSVLGDGKGGEGVVGGIKITAGMPTEVNLTYGLATVGSGDGSGPIPTPTPLPTGGLPSRVLWREIIPK